MARVVVIGGLAKHLVNFRGALLEALVTAGHTVTAMAGDNDNDVSQRLAKQGIDFRRYPLERNRLRPFADCRTYWSLRRLLRGPGPDVVLAYTVKPVIWAGLALRSRRDVRFVALITGLGFALQGTGFRRRFLARVVTILYRWALQRAAVVIFQNLDDRAAFIRLGIVDPDRSACVAGSGVDLEYFKAMPLPEGPPVFLVVSRLLGEKGLREFAAAAAQLKSEGPDVRFLLVGPLESSADAIAPHEIAEWEHAGSVDYLGPVDDVRESLRAAHVYVLPSYHEGMPRSVLEALAVGRPIVTTDVPGCRQTVEPGKNGILVAPRSVEALADGLRACLAQRERWPEWAKQSRQIAESRFDVRAVNREMLKLMGLEN